MPAQTALSKCAQPDSAKLQPRLPLQQQPAAALQARVVLISCASAHTPLPRNSSLPIDSSNSKRAPCICSFLAVCQLETQAFSARRFGVFWLGNLAALSER